ncbi:hypothetical protein C8F01DRAFT_1372047, partial [Mycena amicta]
MSITPQVSPSQPPGPLLICPPEDKERRVLQVNGQASNPDSTTCAYAYPFSLSPSTCTYIASGALAPGSPDSCPSNLIGTPQVVRRVHRMFQSGRILLKSREFSTSPPLETPATSTTSTTAGTNTVAGTSTLAQTSTTHADSGTTGPATATVTVTTGTSAGTPTTPVEQANTSAGMAASSTTSPPSDAGSPVNPIAPSVSAFGANPQVSATSANHNAALIGALVGVIVFLLLVGIAFFIRRRYIRRRRQRLDTWVENSRHAVPAPTASTQPWAPTSASPPPYSPPAFFRGLWPRRSAQASVPAQAYQEEVVVHWPVYDKGETHGSGGAVGELREKE